MIAKLGNREREAHRLCKLTQGFQWTAGNERGRAGLPAKSHTVEGMEKQNFNVFNVHRTEGPVQDKQMLYC